MSKIKNQKFSKGKQTKEPTVGINSDSQHPIFSFRFLQSDYGIDTCSGEKSSAFVRKLNQVSQLTWGEWKLSPRKKNGYEKIDRSSIRTSVPQHITDDVNFFISFRFNDGRCVGYRNELIFYIIWIDCSFKLYNH